MQQQRSFFGTQQATLETPAISRSLDERLAFLRRVYGWMFAGIVATVFGIAIAVESGMAVSLLQAGIFANILVVVAWIGGAYLVQKVRHVPNWNVVAFGAYGLFTGVVISGIVYLAIVMAEMHGRSPGAYIMEAGALTLVAFVGLSAYAFFTRRDFSFLRGILTVGLFVLLGAIVIGFFVESSALQLVISGFGVLLFAGYTLYDTQKVLRTYPDGEHVAGAMTLFIDFVLLFVYILRFILLIASGGRE